MLSIGEFARLGAVSIRTLRHYDEIGLLAPDEVDPVTGYRSYSARQLRQVNRIVALKDLGLTLGQIRQLLDGITADELRGMLLLRQAQLEHELQRQQHHLLGVEARLRHIAQEDDMPADDIVVKQIPPLGVVAIADTAPGWGPLNIVPAVNRGRVKFDQLGISGLVKVAGPFMLFYEHTDGDEITVNVALPVTEEPAELPPPASYRVLPAIEAAAAVRNGPAASIYPMVYQDLVAWVQAHGYQPHGPGRDIWIHEIDDVSDVDQQVFETQLAFSRPEVSA
ncbi:MAG TPA: MerR family transcriptional regulator [Streptosporangiaceae bacterium]|nr:MerR family transcriptional regulator [Streptosporangiaceae bacterium]